MSAGDVRPDAETAPRLSPLATAIVHAVYSCRFLTAPQAARLFCRDGRAAKLMLTRLSNAGYLAAIRRPVVERDTPDTVYALAQRGAGLIASHLGVDRRAVRWRKYHNYVGLPFVEHRLAVNDVRIAFAVGAGMHGYAVEGWWYELPIREDVDDPVEGAPPLLLRPDAYLRLLADSRRLHLFLEVDMATESHLRFAHKIRRYLAYKESGMFRLRWGGRSFRVLTVAPTWTRACALRRVAEKKGAERRFWFTALPDVTPQRLAESVWELAGARGRARLLARPARAGPSAHR